MRRYQVCSGLMVAMAVVACSTSAKRIVRQQVASADGKIYALVVRSGDEGGLGGGTAEQILLSASGARITDAPCVLTWQPSRGAAALRLSWDGPRRLRVTLSGSGSVTDFSNVVAVHVGGKDSAVAVRLDAPFYGDE